MTGMKNISIGLTRVQKLNSTKDRLKEIIETIEACGIAVNTHTKARGNQGIFLKNRIDISKKLATEEKILVLVHEFAHFSHMKLEPEMLKTGGTLEKLFNTEDKIILKIIEKELYEVTLAIDEHARLEKLKAIKNKSKAEILEYERVIKAEYPSFLRSKKFREFDKYIKRSKARYLLKHDRVRFVTPFLRREEYFSIENLESDFPDMSYAFCAYIRLKSAQRRQSRASARMNRLTKYYKKPCELFARFVQAVFKDAEACKSIAPQSFISFVPLLNSSYYPELNALFKLP